MEIGTLSAVTGTSVFVGAAATTGFGMALAADEIAAHTIGASLLWRGIGIALLAPAAIWVILCFGKRHSMTLLGIKLTVPLPVSGMAQLAVAISGWMTAAAVLYELLPDRGGWTFPAFAAVFVAACYLGAASGAPAGVGVFDAAILTFSSHTQTAPDMAAAIIVYRLIYTLAPLGIGAILLGRDLAEDAPHEPRRNGAALGREHASRSPLPRCRTVFLRELAAARARGGVLGRGAAPPIRATARRGMELPDRNSARDAHAFEPRGVIGLVGAVGHDELRTPGAKRLRGGADAAMMDDRRRAREYFRMRHVIVGDEDVGRRRNVRSAAHRRRPAGSRVRR